MKEKFRNIFWFFGIFAIVVMLCTFDMDYQELWQNLRKAGVGQEGSGGRETCQGALLEGL